ncbi:MAG: hypothetical protein DA330_07555 [Nitrososphaera sp.]|nr:hypothetical protein [Nitrososphaera sp.]
MPIQFTRVAAQKFSVDFKQRIVTVYRNFPELDRVIICGCISRGSRLLGAAQSWTNPQKISLQPGVANTVIAHELVHLLQGDGIPHGEKQCDVWTVARLDKELLDSKPHYILYGWTADRWHRNKDAAKQLCIQAIEYRRSNRNYIVWLSEELKRLK